MNWYARWQFWLIVLAVSFSIGFMLGGCERVESKAESQPEPSRVIARFSIGNFMDGTIDVTEFRDSAGRVCVVATRTTGDSRGGMGLAMSCARPLPPLDYEDLPKVEGEQQ